jgi:hypothetical protein
VTDETGSGALVFATSPSLTTPALGTPSSGTLSNCTAASTGAKGVVLLATDAQVWSANSGTAGTVVSASQIESASALVTLTDAATIALDWDTLINGFVIIAGNRTLGNPTNMQQGTYRTVQVFGNDATNRTLSFDTNYLGTLNVPITLITNNSGRAMISLFAFSSTLVIPVGVVRY